MFISTKNTNVCVDMYIKYFTIYTFQRMFICLNKVSLDRENDYVRDAFEGKCFEDFKVLD